MLLYKIFRTKYFILGIVFGLILIQLYPNVREKITIYPSDKVQEHAQYVDSAENCFEFTMPS